jgi:uncharacterized MAPEG superfamily protein
MNVELWLLIGGVVLGLVHLIASSHLISWQRGYRWTASSREEDVPPLRGLANRVDEATTNFLETFPFFAPGRRYSLMVVSAASSSSGKTDLRRALAARISASSSSRAAFLPASVENSIRRAPGGSAHLFSRCSHCSRKAGEHVGILIH